MMASTSKDTAAAAVAGTQENEGMTVENGENDKAPEPLSDVFQEEKDKATVISHRFSFYKFFSKILLV